MQTLWQDLRYGLRVLVKNPSFTLIAVVTLARGIGANTAIFSVVNPLLFRPLPYKDAGQLVWLWGTNPANDIPQETASPPDYADWKSLNQSFADMGAFMRNAGILTTGGEPERLMGAAVTDGFFSVLGAQTKLGRTFLPEEDRPGAERTIILSEGLWQRRFAGDPNILGKSITLNGTPFTVVGVMPADFLNPRPGDIQPAEYWVTWLWDYPRGARRNAYLGVIARLKPGATLQQARTDMNAIAASLQQQ